MIRLRAIAARPPGPAEVVVAVAGVALGVEPAAEIAGVVVGAGDAARDWLGRRVVVPRLLPCGDCDRCRRGHPARCPGRAPRDGLADHETVPARYLVSVEPPLWPAGAELWQLAALADAASQPYGALVRAGVTPGEPVLVLGDGWRAAFTRAVVSAIGAHPITRDEIDPKTHGWKIVETTATAAARAEALSLLPDGGTAIFLDSPEPAPEPHPHPVDWERFARSEAHLLGATACHPDLLPELCALVVRGALGLAPLVERISIDAAAAHPRHGAKLAIATWR